MSGDICGCYDCSSPWQGQGRLAPCRAQDTPTENDPAPNVKVWMLRNWIIMGKRIEFNPSSHQRTEHNPEGQMLWARGPQLLGLTSSLLHPKCVGVNMGTVLEPQQGRQSCTGSPGVHDVPWPRGSQLGNSISRWHWDMCGCHYWGASAVEGPGTLLNILQALGRPPQGRTKGEPCN
jgi:hypothetical protein